VYGYLSLPTGVMQAAGSAAQTIAGIRSHWGRRTFADERTIAVAACLSEPTVRLRHIPKLTKLGFLDYRLVDGQKAKRKEWFFHVRMRDIFFGAKSITLPRWAALILPEWSHRAVYAAVLQRSLATSRGSAKTDVPLEPEEVASGNYGRHNFSLSDLEEQTSLVRHSVHAAKASLLRDSWLLQDEGYGRGHELFINCDKIVPKLILAEAHRTTRSMMFKNKKEPAHAAA
jgi:hypothetical protein